MGLIDTIQNWLRRPVARAYFVDAGGLLGGGRFRPQPRDQVRAMQNLARFAGRENLRVTLAWQSPPLRDAPEGAPYEGLSVFYVGPDGNVADRLLPMARRAGAGAVVVTADRELEAAALKAGVATMRLQSWLRAMGGDAPPDGRDGNRGPNRNNERRPRPPRRRPPRGSRPTDNPAERGRETMPDRPSAQGHSASVPTPSPKADSPVSELIDLV